MMLHRSLILQQITANDVLSVLSKIKSLIKLFWQKSILGKVSSKSIFTFVKIVSKSILKIQDRTLSCIFKIGPTRYYLEHYLAQHGHLSNFTTRHSLYQAPYRPICYLHSFCPSVRLSLCH